ncbi:TPA: hypothetical protein DCZ46_03015 [Candidatus Campbellbacteria bacterium]|nr:MAG: hypothetical protein UR58_C0001G0574 [Candidatus Campbellbacteria bacterium GW2011_OD1_34_28]KKP74902.1 MAG: hypothetical protein UR74_C0002G0168 [Candidatus Campbellbacteria bacterium GW2011_GWD2_35_24]KKP75788.1 MAG: hypothetical protein UR75_C0002G0169 [Candidatus Campbellbacteria bacterium GW2011_GWC2_35_28]KKP76964.1 MAG: hypothetical protein UR76_C0002G0165 [Candidatus Campbellbacteria bacterium GW2011_GWC1_35_31]KKP78890.1 MAG: hypothetical protein UR79_C0002G0165 [Candidatus Cam
MDFYDKKLQKELALIRDTSESENGEIKIIDYLKPLVFSVGNKFIDEFEIENGIVIEDREIVLKSGWIHLDFAIKKYMEKIEIMERGEGKIFIFSEYFTWFIKQGILEYLQSKYKN